MCLDVGYDVSTSWHGSVCLVHAYLYVRPLLFKEIIFPYLIDQATRISLQYQLWNIPKVVIIF